MPIAAAAAFAARLLGTGAMTAAEVNAARVAGGATATELKMAYALRKIITEGGDQEGSPVPEELTVPVNSTAIRAIGWRNDGTITVVFIRGGTYTYDSNYETFIAFTAAPSKGAFFNAHFR